MMKVGMKRLMAAMLALMMLALPVMVFGEEDTELPGGKNEEEAMNEEDTSTVYQPEAGDYEWYMLPADVDETHAYLDIYPVEETVQGDYGMWNVGFLMEECNGFDFRITSITLICFNGDTEISREPISAEKLAEICPDGKIAANTMLSFADNVFGEDLTACAISVIGVDSTDEELEFHSLVYLS